MHFVTSTAIPHTLSYNLSYRSNEHLREPLVRTFTEGLILLMLLADRIQSPLDSYLIATLKKFRLMIKGILSSIGNPD